MKILKMALCFLVLVVGACEIDMAGLTALDDFALRKAESARVGSVICAADSLAIAAQESTYCNGLGENGARLSWQSSSFLIWSTSNNAIASVDQSGRVLAESTPGEVWVRAEGAFESSDSARIVVH